MAPPLALLPPLSAALSALAFALVSRDVAEPYLDEIFHIPQTQRYCVGDYTHWDPSITTPPGLYVLSAGALRLLRQPCTPASLRATSLALAFGTAAAVHALLPGGARGRRAAEAATVASFPLVFFFANLYYTDVASAAAVLAMFAAAAHGRHWAAGLAGAAGLTVRQTNVVWVGFALALSLARALRVPDPRLADASLADVARAAAAAIRAAARRPATAARAAAPYLPALLGFAAFLAWNGGVVLGHHAHHAAAPHFAQLLYLLGFAAAMLWPTLVGGGTARAVRGALALGLGTWRCVVAVAESWRPGQVMAARPPPSHARVARAARADASRAAVSAAALALFNVVVGNFTIVHPFLLADNRHYVFYVFRRVVARTWWSKHALTPAYLAAGWAWAWRARSVSLLWALGFALCSAAVLVPTPLVEPRYFLVPTLLLRVELARADAARGGGGSRGEGADGAAVDDAAGNDDGARGDDGAALWVEWAWYAAVNAATTGLFLAVKFRWEGWDGWMRFMW